MASFWRVPLTNRWYRTDDIREIQIVPTQTGSHVVQVVRRDAGTAMTLGNPLACVLEQWEARTYNDALNAVQQIVQPPPKFEGSSLQRQLLRGVPDQSCCL